MVTSLSLSQRYCNPSSLTKEMDNYENVAMVAEWFSHCFIIDHLSRVMRKPVFGVSDKIPHKRGEAG